MSEFSSVKNEIETTIMVLFAWYKPWAIALLTWEVNLTGKWTAPSSDHTQHHCIGGDLQCSQQYEFQPIETHFSKIDELKIYIAFLRRKFNNSCLLCSVSRAECHVWMDLAVRATKNRRVSRTRPALDRLCKGAGGNKVSQTSKQSWKKF